MEMFGIEIKRKPKQKKSMEFSKKILVVSWLSGSFVITFALWLTYKMVLGGYSGDVSLVAIILSGGFAEIAAGTGFYYYKAKAENVIKIQQQYGLEMAEKVREEIE